MREAVVAARAALSRMQEQLRVAEQELAGERQQLADAERRGKLAAEIGDQETVAVAERFAAKHAERVAVLERKVAVQRDETVMVERELADMTEQLKTAQSGRVGRDATDHAASARAGMAGLDQEDELMKSRLDRAAREAAAEEQLQALKKKMGKRGAP
jgi:hypothetical protein